MRARLVLRSVLCAALAGAASLGVVGSAHAAPLSAPLSLKSTGSNPPELSWAPVAGAVRYEVEADTEPGFSSPPVHTTTVDTSYVPQTLLAAGDYYWQVRAIDADNVDSDWAAGSDFTISPVDPPSGLKTNDDAGAPSLAQPDDPPTLTWTPVAGAKSYTVQVAQDSTFSGAKVYTTQSPRLVVSDPLAPQSYVWHVKAELDTGIESQYSANASFTVGSIATPSGLRVIGTDGNTIADNQDVQDVILDWSAVPGAKSYDLQVSKDNSFSASSIVDNRTGLVATRYSPATTYDNSQYFWRVRAVDLSGNPTVWSDAGPTTPAPTFRRQWTERPSLVVPDPSQDGAVVHDPVSLQWTPVHHASHYQVQLGSDPNFSPGTFNQCLVAGTTYTPGSFEYDVVSGNASRNSNDQCLPTPGAITYWRVRGLDAPFSSNNGTGVQGLWSDTHSFIYSTDADRLTGTSPADGATVDVPVLSWSPVRGAETYAISVLQSGSTVASTTTHALSYVPVPWGSTPLAAGSYTWTIVAKDPNGTALTPTETHNFKVSGSIPSDGSPALTAHTGNSSTTTTRAPLLSWTPVQPTGSQKITYKIDAGQHGTGVWFDPTSSNISPNLLETALAYPAVTDISTAFSKPGSYDWQVKAYDGNTLLATSPVYTFTVAALAAVPSQQLALSASDFSAGRGCTATVGGTAACQSVPATPVIDWQPVAGASFYVLYIAKDANFTNRIENDSAMPATTSTRWTPDFAQVKSALAESQVGESYFVHIRACSSLKSCGPDPTSSTGRATLQFTKKSPPVALESPADTTTVSAATINFDWDDYLDSNAAVHWPNGASPTTSYQGAMQYRIQIDDDPNFGSPLETATVDQSTYTSPSKLYPDGKLYWRVQAIDVDNNDLAWSQTRSFTKRSAAPTLDAPIGGATTGENPVLSWSPQAYAANYTVELYRNGDTAFSSANQVFSTSVKQTAFVYTQPLPPSGSPYVWRVAAVDASGNPGPFGQPATFTVSGTSPALVSPATGATLPADHLVLRWSPVVGAVSYQVQVQQATGSTSIDTATTRATAYAPSPQQLIRDGGISWRVIAEDSNNQELGTSGWRSVIIKAAPTPLHATTSPRITGTRTVGSMLTVDPGTWPATSPQFTYQWLRNGAPIAGATNSIYTLAFADAATQIGVQVTASKSGWGDGTASSNSVTIPKAASTVSALATLTTLKQRKSTSLVATVSVPSVYGVAPTGSIRVIDRLGAGRQRTLKTVSLTASAKGQKTISVRLTGVGLHHLRALYLGSTKIAGSSSPVVKVHTTR